MSPCRIQVSVLCLAVPLLLVPGCARLGKVYSAMDRREPAPQLAAPDSSSQVYVDCKAVLGREGLSLSGWTPFAHWLSFTEGVLVDSSGRAFDGVAVDNLLMFFNLPPGSYRLSSVSARYALSEKERKEAYGSIHSPGDVRMAFAVPPAPEFGAVLQPGEFVYLGRLRFAERHDLARIGGDQKGPERWESPGPVTGYGGKAVWTVTAKPDPHQCDVGSYELEHERKREADAMKHLIEMWKVGKWEERSAETGWREAWTERWRARLQELKSS